MREKICVKVVCIKKELIDRIILKCTIHYFKYSLNKIQRYPTDNKETCQVKIGMQE